MPKSPSFIIFQRHTDVTALSSLGFKVEYEFVTVHLVMTSALENLSCCLFPFLFSLRLLRKEQPSVLPLSLQIACKLNRLFNNTFLDTRLARISFHLLLQSLVPAMPFFTEKVISSQQLFVVDNKMFSKVANSSVVDSTSATVVKFVHFISDGIHLEAEQDTIANEHSLACLPSWPL